MAENKETAYSRCSGMKRVRDREEQRQLLSRLNRTEEQIREVKKIFTEDVYYIDILNQVSAANRVLDSFTKVLLTVYLESCVTEDVREGSAGGLDELVRTLQKLMR